MAEMRQMNLESRKKFFFDSLKEIFWGMTTFQHIYHQITALIRLIFVNANWFYHIFWRHLIKRIKSIKENTICANSLIYILVFETDKLFIMKTWFNKTTLNKKTFWTFSILMCKNFFIKKKRKLLSRSRVMKLLDPRCPICLEQEFFQQNHSKALFLSFISIYIQKIKVSY